MRPNEIRIAILAGLAVLAVSALPRVAPASEEGFPAVLMGTRGTIVSRPGVAIETDDPRRRGRKARAILYCFSGAAVVLVGGTYFALNGMARGRVGSIVNDGVYRGRLVDAGETSDPGAAIANALFRVAVDRCPIS